MPQYAAGIKNTESIVSAAKQLFWEKGFEATPVNAIAKQAGIRRTLFFYYYPTKSDLAKEIFDEFHEQMETMLQQAVAAQGIELNAVLYRGVFVALNLRTILSNPELSRFAAEVDNGVLQIQSKFVRDKYKKLLAESTIDPPKRSFDLTMVMNLGINTMLFRLYSQNLLEDNLDEIIRFKLQVMYESVYPDQESIDAIVDQVFALEKQFRFTVNPQFNLTLTVSEQETE